MSLINIQTRDFGEVPIDSDKIISFPFGIYAFEEDKSFALLSPLGEDNHPMWLQSTEKPELCFIVFNPREMIEGYNPELTDEQLQLIGTPADGELMYLSIAVIPENHRKSTINLKSPIIVNTSSSTAAQVIVAEDYQIKHPIFSGEEDA